jgi:hypothetical protein
MLPGLFRVVQRAARDHEEPGAEEVDASGPRQLVRFSFGVPGLPDRVGQLNARTQQVLGHGAITPMPGSGDGGSRRLPRQLDGARAQGRARWRVSDLRMQLVRMRLRVAGGRGVRLGRLVHVSGPFITFGGGADDRRPEPGRVPGTHPGRSTPVRGAPRWGGDGVDELADDLVPGLARHAGGAPVDRGGDPGDLVPVARIERPRSRGSDNPVPAGFQPGGHVRGSTGGGGLVRAGGEEIVRHRVGNNCGGVHGFKGAGSPALCRHGLRASALPGGRNALWVSARKAAAHARDLRLVAAGGGALRLASMCVVSSTAMLNECCDVA